MFKSKNIVRDMLFFVLLLFMSREALERSLTHIKQENIHTIISEQSEVHELDGNFLVSLEETKRQIATTIKICQTSCFNEKMLEQLQKMKQKIKEIEQKFKKNSPATFLLGPLGTTAIVLKEKDLEKKLIKIMNDLGNILYEFQNKQSKANIAIVSVEQGIARNRDLLGYIT